MVVLYLALATANVDRPGVQYDEALYAPATLRLLRPELANEIPVYSAFRLAGRWWPDMSLSYVGALKSYLLALSFLVIEPGVLALRLVGIGLGAAAVVLTYALARRGWGAGCALIAAGALATDPSFLLMTRADWGPVALAAFFRTAALLALVAWLQSRRRWPLAAAGLLLGLGVYDKASFLWFVLALVAVGAAARFLGRVRSSPGELVTVVAAFFVGSSPFWVWNATHNWETFRFAAQGNLPQLAQGLPLTAALLQALPSRLNLLHDLLAGRQLDVLMFGGAVEPWLGPRSDSLLVPVLALSAGLVGLCALTPARRRVRWLRLLFPLALAGLLLAQMLASPLNIWLHHLVSLYPLPHLFVGAALAEVVAASRPGLPRRLVTAVAGLATLALVVGNLALMQRYQQLMAWPGGQGNWSPAIYEVTRVLASEYPGRTVQTLDWGATNQLLLLSRGELRIQDLWTYVRGGGGQNTARRAISDPRNLFLLRAPGTENFPRAAQTFWQVVQESGRQPCEQRVFAEATGRPLYQLVSFSGCRQDSGG